MDVLDQILRHVRRRIGVQQWIHFTVYAFFWAYCISFLWVLVCRLFPMLGDPLPWCVGLLTLAVVFATGTAVRRWPSQLRAALETDERLGLDERVTSSLEFAGETSPMIDAIHRDARAHIQGAYREIRRLFPLTASRSLRWVYLPLVLFIASLYLPEFDLLGYRQRVAQAETEKKAVRVSAQRLREAIKPLKRESQVAPPAELEKMAGAIEKIAKEMEEQSITTKKALAKLSNLAEKLERDRKALSESNPMPKLAGNPEGLESLADLADDIQQGKAGEAKKKVEKLLEKLKSGEMTESEMESLSEEMTKLAMMMKGNETELGQALAESLAGAAKAMSAKNLSQAAASLEGMEMALADLESIMEQIEAMDGMLAGVGEWGRGMYGRYGEGWQPGQGNGRGMGPGMGGPGRGRGNRVGDLPDAQAGFQPSRLPGEMTKGKMIASILQQGLPDSDADATVDFTEGAFVELQQQAEQALTKEEIPPGAKEFVRQYFYSIEPEKN